MVDNTTQQQQQPTNEDASLLAQLSSLAARPTNNNQHQPGFPTFNHLAFGGGLPPLGSYMGSGGYPGTSPSNHLYGYGPHAASHRSNENGIDTPEGAESEQRKPSGMTPLILASMPTLAQPSFAAGSHHSHQQILQVVSSDSHTDNAASATDTTNPAAVGMAGVAAGTNGEQKSSSKKWARWVSRK